MSMQQYAYYKFLKGIVDAKAETAAVAQVKSETTQKQKPAQEAKPGQKKGKAGVDLKGANKVTFNVPKYEDFALWFEQICVIAELIDKTYPVKGMPVFRPYGYYMHSAIMNCVEAEWDAMGTQKVQFPALIPRVFLEKEKEHVKGFEGECFWVTRAGLNELPREEWLALRPTSETAMYSMFQTWVRSYRDLPLQVHQTCAVYRHETKDTRPLIRIREIYWNEAHTCHASAQDAIAHLEDAWKGYMRVITDILGCTGVRLRRPDWDRFAGAEHTDVLDTIMPCGRVLQTVGAHYLGQKFAKVFDIKFLNKQQKDELGYMTCYGVSTRILAAVLATHGDNRGLVLPATIARVQVLLVPVLPPGYKGQLCDATTAAEARAVAQELKAAGIRAFVDDSDELPGNKFYYWEVRGVPLRIEIGARDMAESKVTFVRRDREKEKRQVSKSAVVSEVQSLFAEQLKELRAKCFDHHTAHVETCHSIEEVRVRIGKGGFARVPFIGMGHDCKEAEAVIRDATGGEVRGFAPFEEKPAIGVLCIATGQQATVYGYVARAY
eukprot:TRINITY_DN1289_c0_g1_i4.p2 TRINITY_DN1289_c0_g1~~TRINITY_DN1289_c0_g1_i4.p2  ORF type:complete len:550 (+),score=99.71 TRINITY_DN1289_c0_g1_i4:31-1680(+)